VVCTEVVSILYRNYAQEGSRNVERRLNTNLKNVFDSNMTNILSVSVRYFIDYNIIK
jgi:RNA polymerase-interacting CarD/CdnL/TRCF family regulator